MLISAACQRHWVKASTNGEACLAATRQSETPARLTEAAGSEAKTYDLNDPADKEQMLASLRAEGVSDEDAQKIIINVPENAAAPGSPESF